MTVRIGQLTDIHVADFADLRPIDMLGKRATGLVNFERKRRREYEPRIVAAAVQALVEARPDAVFVTGDLTNLGLPSELKAALALLEPLRSAGIATYVFPGNHDYYVPAASHGAFEAVAEPWQHGRRTGGAPYPFAVDMPGATVVCFNSAVPAPPLMAWGRIDAAQLDAARQLVRDHRGGHVVFALHHHPTRAPERKAEWTRNLRGARGLRSLAAEVGASLIVHGHNHHEHARRLREAPGVIVSGISSTTTNRTAPPERVANVAIYKFAPDAEPVIQLGRWNGTAFGAWDPVDSSTIAVESAHEADVPA